MLFDFLSADISFIKIVQLYPQYLNFNYYMVLLKLRNYYIVYIVYYSRFTMFPFRFTFFMFLLFINPSNNGVKDFIPQLTRLIDFIEKLLLFSNISLTLLNQ